MFDTQRPDFFLFFLPIFNYSIWETKSVRSLISVVILSFLLSSHVTLTENYTRSLAISLALFPIFLSVLYFFL